MLLSGHQVLHRIAWQSSAVDRNYSVRQLEAKIREIQTSPSAAVAIHNKDADIASIETPRERGDQPTGLDPGRRPAAGISSFSLTEFEGVLERLLRKPTK